VNEVVISSDIIPIENEITRSSGGGGGGGGGEGVGGSGRGGGGGLRSKLQAALAVRAAQEDAAKTAAASRVSRSDSRRVAVASGVDRARGVISEGGDREGGEEPLLASKWGRPRGAQDVLVFVHVPKVSRTQTYTLEYTPCQPISF